MAGLLENAPRPLDVAYHIQSTKWVKQYMEELETVYEAASNLLKDVPSSVREKAPVAVKYAEESVENLRWKLDKMVAFKSEAREATTEAVKEKIKEKKSEGKKFAVIRAVAEHKKETGAADGAAVNMLQRLKNPDAAWEDLAYYQNQILLAMQMLQVAIVLYK
ncbi:hypothetical protein QOT17_020559 [Balamuthia mandrillaris]